jgi:branched-subunit amino acid transport protein
MSAFALWCMIGGVALGTFAFRLSFLYLFAARAVPPPVERALRFVPPAVLAVLVLPALAYVDGQLALSGGNERLWAGLAAALAAGLTRSVVLTLLVGMLALWGLQGLVGL